MDICRQKRWILLLIASLATCGLGATADEPPTPLSPPPVGQGADIDQPDDPPADDIDSLLNMDVAELGNVNVRDTAPTFSDPVVEGVSRSAEKSSTAPGVVQVITAEQIRAYGGKTLREVLERGTSVWTPNSIYAPNNVTSIRGDLFGHYDNHVLLLLNNRPFKDTNQGGMHMAIYNSFPIETLERIEIIRGPGSVLYGTNAYAGVINLVTKDSETARTGASVLAGSDDAQRYGVTVASGCKHESLYVGAMSLNEGGFLYSGFDEASSFFSKPFGQDNVGVVSVYKNGNLSFNAFYGQTEQSGLGTALGVAHPSGYYTAVRAFADVGYVLGGEELSLDTHFTYNYSDQSSLNPGGEISHFVSNDYLLEPILRAQLTDRLSWMTGATFEVREGYLRPQPNIPEYRKIWYSVYTQAQYQATDWLLLTGGCRAICRASSTVVLPRVPVPSLR